MRIGIIGTGLIGGSLGLALKSSKKPYHISCWNRRKEVSERAVKLGAADEYFSSLVELVDNSDVLVLATPLGSYKHIMEEISPHITSDQIITDVGSVKTLPINEALKFLPKKLHGNFVPSHPIAGKEKARIDQAEAKLFRTKLTIICGIRKSPAKVKVIKHIWQDVGSKIILMDMRKHDQTYAFVSHYVQFLSFKLKKFFPKPLGDFSRLMNSPTEIWDEIFHYNRINLKKINAHYIKALEKYVKSLKAGAEIYPAEITAKMLISMTPKAYIKYAGTGYKSFTSIVKNSNKGEKMPAAEAAKFLGKIINEFKKAKF